MVAAVDTKVSQLPVEVGWDADTPVQVSQLNVEVGMTTTAAETFASQLPVEVGWFADNTTFFSQVNVEVVFRGRPVQREMRAWSINIDGHSWYILHCGDDEGTLVYDQTTGQWAEWQSQTSNNAQAPYRGRCGWNWGTDLIVGDDNVGILWNMAPDHYQDEGAYEGTDSFPINAQLTGGVPQRLRDSTAVGGVMLTYSAGYPVGGLCRVLLETSDDQGFTYDSQGYVTATVEKLQDIQWLSLGQISQPLRIFRISDNGIARIDSLDFW